MNKELDCFEICFILAVFFAGFIVGYSVIAESQERLIYVKQGCIQIPTYGSSNMTWKCPSPEKEYSLPKFGEKDAQ
jgi:hypothetical protein